MAIDIVDLPIKNADFPHSYVRNYQMVLYVQNSVKVLCSKPFQETMVQPAASCHVQRRDFDPPRCSKPGQPWPMHPRL